MKNQFSIFIIACLLSACGFTPLHRQGLVTLPVKINEIRFAEVKPSKSNLIFKQSLEEAFNFKGETVYPQYSLNINLNKAFFGFATQNNSINSRKRIDLIANYVLFDLSTDKMISSDKVIVTDSIEITISPYSNLISEEEVLNTLARELAEEIKLRIASEIVKSS